MTRDRLTLWLALLVGAWCLVEAAEWLLQVVTDLAYKRGGGF